ncbi:MAG: RES domain-containing protein [Lentisphaeria bacterium]
MSHDLNSLKQMLATAPAVAVNTTLFRRVTFQALASYTPPNWLYTSGKPQRYNPAGVDCVYFGADTNITRVEFESLWQGLQGANQPATDFCVAVALQRVLDLTSATTLKALKISAQELFKSWRRTKTPTLTQLLGLAVNETRLFSAIRYPSKATADRGQAGINFVIFRDCVQFPDLVEILGPTSKPLQTWPSSNRWRGGA